MRLGSGSWFSKALKSTVSSPGLAADRSWSWLPSQCAICKAWPSRPVCDECVAAFAQPVHRCPRCALQRYSATAHCPECLTDPPPWHDALTAVSYQWPWVDLIAQFKYQAQPGWSGTLASLMHSAPGVDDALAQNPLLIPMPMHKLRWAERGFNPALLLAQHLSPLHTCTDVLLRVRHTPAQRSLPRSERLNNLEGAFQLDPLKTHLLRDRHVLLVDDVMTTGASLRSATKTLLAAGPASVSILVLARTERPGIAMT